RMANVPGAMRPYLRHEHPIRLAHRGSRVLWPENTMEAFAGAAGLGYRYVETDVHVSADGKVVVFHDDRLDALTDGTGNVSDHPWDHLATLDAAHHFAPGDGYPLRGTGVRIPLLSEAVAAFPEMCWNIDLKQAGIEQAVATEVARLGIEDRVLIGSFHDGRIRRFRRITAGRVATSAGPGETARALASARVGRAPAGAADAYQVPERAGGLTVAGRRFVEAAHRAGKQVHVWTVNDAAAMRRLLDLGVDGIVTDRPDVLNDVLDERGTR
ncbi:MAG: glycerophosphodiester phosphodiesterase, partial [Actinobacteria bacterium]|nr:glycerophosphodiester phosphodiesterase [Actinomycetota bacterium]